MKNRLHYIATSLMLSVGLVSFNFAAPAKAEPTIPNPVNITKISEKVETIDKTSKKFVSRVVLSDSKNTEVIETAKIGSTLAEIFEENGLDSNSYKDSDSKPIDVEYVPNNGETIAFFKTEISGTSETIVLKAPETTKETDTLYIGETAVETEGVDGEALKTTLTTTILASDKTLNKKANQIATPTKNVQEKLTILKAPIAKVTLVGIKEIPEPEPEPEPEPVLVEPSRTSNANGGNVSNNAKVANVQQKEYTTSVTLSDVDQNDVVALAEAQLGKPYIWGAAGPNAFDCSGLVYFIYHDHKGMKIPRTANAQGIYSTPVSPENIAVGDILWTPSHIGIYVGNGDIIHAPNPSKPVGYAKLDTWLKNGYKIGRL